MSAEDLCLRCEISGSLEGAVADEAAVPRVGIARDRRAGGRILIGLLVALNVAGVIGWLFARPAPGPELDAAFDAVDTVTRAVEARRRYVPSPDRSRFSVFYVAQPEAGAPEPVEDDR